MSTDNSTGLIASIAQALWGQPLRVEPLLRQGDAARAVITGDGEAGHVLHLPVVEGLTEDHALAVAAHAAAHLRFGAEPQSRAGLKPVQQALRGVLEDARVEWLAMQELPGLRRVWWPYHGGRAASGGGSFEDLLARLSAILLDPSQHDPHPWIARVKALFFKADGRTLALLSAQDVRNAASVLGNEIGQMRLPFNARTYAVHAACRDDNSHLWLPDDSLPPSDAELAQSNLPAESGGSPAGATTPAIAEAPAAGVPVARHAEWDHRIRRYRPDWCSVHAPAPVAGRPRLAPDADAMARRVAGRLAGLQGRPERIGGFAHHGEHLHPAAMADAWADLRAGRTPDARVHVRQGRPSPPLAVLMLLDASASTARGDALARMQQAALSVALALQRLGHRSALWAFSSHGRHQVNMPCLKDWSDTVASLAWPALHGEGSTRMGAALRHGLWLSNADARRHPGLRRVIVLLTDGELHDVDVHDPAYLPADLQRAAREAMVQGVAVRALVFSPGEPGALDPALGHGHGTGVADPSALPAALFRTLSDVVP